MRPVPALSHVSATGQGNRVGFARISPPLGLPREDGWGRKDMEGRGRGPGPTDWPQHRAWPGWAGEGARPATPLLPLGTGLWAAGWQPELCPGSAAGAALPWDVNETSRWPRAKLVGGPGCLCAGHASVREEPSPSKPRPTHSRPSDIQEGSREQGGGARALAGGWGRSRSSASTACQPLWHTRPAQPALGGQLQS